MYYFITISEPSEVSVLVPGAGLGRLAWEIAHLGMSPCVSLHVICSDTTLYTPSGYQCQGNEFSMYMLFGSHFILNE